MWFKRRNNKLRAKYLQIEKTVHENSKCLLTASFWEPEQLENMVCAGVKTGLDPVLWRLKEASDMMATPRGVSSDPCMPRPDSEPQIFRGMHLFPLTCQHKTAFTKNSLTHLSKHLIRFPQACCEECPGSG